MRVLIVDDEENFRRVLTNELRREGCDISSAATGEEALEMLGREEPDVLLLDIRLPGIDGIEVLKKTREMTLPPEVIMLTGQATVEDAIASMKKGAYDFLTKPCRTKEIVAVLEKAAEKRRVTRENAALHRLVKRKEGEAEIIGESPAIVELRENIERTARSDLTTLVLGESGAGKELVALALHRKSPRANRPFVVIHCGALQAGLLESELFGHKKGAFTGAHADNPGILSVADGGTVFLDEVAELPPEIQAKMLRFLEAGEIRPVGSPRTVRLNVRLVVATNRDLLGEVRAGRFREDLYHRLNIMNIVVPPLRERRKDIPLLAAHFLAGTGKRLGQGAVSLMQAYRWPGNVRELKNLLERLAVIVEQEEISAGDVEPHLNYPVSGEFALPPDMSLAELEKAQIRNVLVSHGGEKTASAKVLGISLKTLYNKIKQYGIRT